MSRGPEDQGVSVYRCKECGRRFEDEDLDELVERVRGHIRVDHGKQISRRRIRRSIEP